MLIIPNNFIYTFYVNELLCDELIDYHKQNNEYKNYGVTHPTNILDKTKKESIDVTFFNNSNHPSIKNYFSELQKGYDEYVKMFNIGHMKLITSPATNIQYYPPGGGYKVWHWERDNGDEKRQLVFMTYLNNVLDGGTEWYYQNYKLEAKKALSVIWPSDFTHMHKGIISKNKEKWIVTGWFEYY
jgi:hypothetical protein